MKTKEIKRYNLPADRYVLKHLEAKPYELMIIISLVIFVLSYSVKWYYGGILVLFGLVLFVIMPNRLLVEFTDTYLVLYNKGNSADCVIVYYEDIVSWKYESGFKEDELIITLTDGSTQKVEAYSKIKFENAMNAFLEEKKEKK